MTASANAVGTIDLLKIDASAEAERICHYIRETIQKRLKRRGAVVAVSGGIDSSVVVSLCTRALGKDRVVALFLPETESSSASLDFGTLLAKHLGVRSFTENISGILSAAGCYKRRDDAIRTVVPEFGEGWKSKIVLPAVSEKERYAVFNVVVQSPAGERKSVRLTADAYLGILAATNFKQRTRKMLEYHYADRFQYAVAGTPNRLEYDQGFFVKGGDGLADFKPIAHLYKSQVYQMAEYLGVPEQIRRRPPTTDTYTLEQSQEEFYFALPLLKLDICLYGKNNGIAPEKLAPIVGLTEAEVINAYAMIDAKRAATRYLHEASLIIDKVL